MKAIYDKPHAFRVPDRVWRRFVKWCKLNGKTPSEQLRQWVEAVR